MVYVEIIHLQRRRVHNERHIEYDLNNTPTAEAYGIH